MVTASFVLCVGMKPGSGSTYYSGYTLSFLFFLIIWILVSFSLEKYNFRIISSWGTLIKKIMISNLLIFFIVTSLMYVFQSFNYSRFIVLGTVGVATFIELLFGSFYLLIANVRVKYENTLSDHDITSEQIKDLKVNAVVHLRKSPRYDFKQREAYLINEIGSEAYDFIKNYAAIDSANTLVIATTTRFNIDAQIQHQFECIVNVKRVNDFRYINKYFESVNAKLPGEGFLLISLKPRICGKSVFSINTR